jgi:O-antigen/teichoic acid export membrane protein
MKKIVAINTVSQLIGKVVSAVAAFIVTFLVARQLGASGYGDFVKITTYIAFFYLLADFGINAVYLQQAQSRTSWPALILIRTMGGLILIALALILAMLLPGTRTSGYTSLVRLGILFYSPTILFQAWITTGNAVFQKRLRYDFSAWAIFFGSLVTVGLLWALFFVWQLPGVTGALLALAAGALGTAATTMCFTLRIEPHRLPRISLRDVMRLFVPSIPLGVTLIFNLVYFRADSVVITLTRPTAEVGIYGLAYKVFEVVLVFPTFFMNAVYPFMVSETAGQSHGRLTKIFTQSFIFLLSMSIAVAAGVWVAAPLLSIVKSDFMPSIWALRVLALGLPFFFVTSATMWALIALKKQFALAIIYGVSMIFNVAGNILLVPAYGFMAAAWLTVVSEGLVLVLSGFVLVQSFSLSKKIPV